MRDSHRRIELREVVIVLAATAMLAGIASLSHDNIASQFLATAIVALFGFCYVVWISFDRGFDALGMTSVFAVLVTTRIAALFIAPLLEDDHFRYLWDGYVAATTSQPFAHPPSHFFNDATVPPSMQSALNGINNPDIPTIYGPLLQIIFAFCYWVAPGALWPFKLVLLCAEIAVTLLLRSANVMPRWILLYVLHPLILKESAITAHPDVLIGAALLAAALAWARGREAIAAIFVCVAISIKLSALVALPFFLLSRRGRISAPGIVASLTGLSALFILSIIGGGGELRALATFGEQWTFNPLLFRFAAPAFGDSAARILIAIVFIALAFGFALVWWTRLRRGTSIVGALTPPIVPALTALLLLSPVVNPWYWLWLFPLAIVDYRNASSRIAIAAASISLLAYAHVGAQVLTELSITTFTVPWWATLAQLATILLVALWTIRRSVERAPLKQQPEVLRE